MAQWYYMQGTEQQGPVSGSELKRLAREGRIGPEHLVWREGLPKWVYARMVPDLIPAQPELDVFDVVEEPESAGPVPTDLASPPRVGKGVAQPGSFFEPPPPRLKSRAAEAADPGLSAAAKVLYGLLFLLIPGANVILSSVLYYVWRSEKPRSARQINWMGFSIFGVHLAIGIGAMAVRLRNEPANLGGPVAVQPAPGRFGIEPPANAPVAPAVLGQFVSRYESPSGAFSIEIPAGKWRDYPERPNPVAEAMWKREGREAYVMAIFEPLELSIEQLKQAALQNLRNMGATPEVMEEVNISAGEAPVTRMITNCTAANVPLTYCSSYYTGPRGSLQLVGFCSQQEFAELRPELEAFLNGLAITPGEPPPPPSRFVSPSGKFSIDIPEGKWRSAPRNINPIAEGIWQRIGADAIAMVIFEQAELTLDQLKQAALRNIEQSGTTPRIVEEKRLQLEGSTVVQIVLECEPQGIPLTYLNVYYGGPEGCLQVVTFSGREDFERLRPDFEEFVQGLRIGPTKAP